MSRAVDRADATRVRLLLAIGLTVNFAGFVYDWAWHAWNLSLVPIPPSKLLTVHSGIYVGSLLVAVAAARAVAGRVFTSRTEWLGLAVIALGLLLEFLGDGLDMWAHGHGYEKDLYHDLIYHGAGLTLVGYLVIELFQLHRAGRPAPH